MSDNSYLPGVEVNRDHEGGSSRARPFHCTSARLTPTITPNVGNSNAQFLLVGDCVRAIPLSVWVGSKETINFLFDLLLNSFNVCQGRGEGGLEAE